MELKGFIGGTSLGRSAAIDSQRSMNLYPELNEAAGKSAATLIGTAGLRLITSGTSGSTRGLFTTGSGRLFGVIGNSFVEVKSTGIQRLGGLSSFGGRVSIAESINTQSATTQIMIVDGIKGYIYDVSAQTFEVIGNRTGWLYEDSDGKITTVYEDLGATSIYGNFVKTYEFEGYLAGTHVVWYNGYFVQNVVGQNKFIFSQLYDGKTWDALDYYVAEGNPDNVTALATVNNELWIFGTKSAEVWYVTGDAEDPFARQSNAYINVGVKSTASVCVLLNSILWLGASESGNNMVWQAQGLIPQRISTNAIEYMLSQMSTTSDCWAYTYTQEGHTFYVLNFYIGNRTLVYDVSTDIWHERGSFNAKTGDNDVHRACCAVEWNNMIVVGDSKNSNIYELDLDTYTDNGVLIKRFRQTPHYHNSRKRMFWNSLELDFERGVGKDVYETYIAITSARYQTTFGNSNRIQLTSN